MCHQYLYYFEEAMEVLNPGIESLGELSGFSQVVGIRRPDLQDSSWQHQSSSGA
jgi:hypothetical protein